MSQEGALTATKGSGQAEFVLGQRVGTFSVAIHFSEPGRHAFAKEQRDDRGGRQTRTCHITDQRDSLARSTQVCRNRNGYVAYRARCSVRTQVRDTVDVCSAMVLSPTGSFDVAVWQENLLIWEQDVEKL